MSENSSVLVPSGLPLLCEHPGTCSCDIWEKKIRNWILYRGSECSQHTHMYQIPCVLWIFPSLKNTNTNTQMQIHKYKYTNTKIQYILISSQPEDMGESLVFVTERVLGTLATLLSSQVLSYRKSLIESKKKYEANPIERV